MNVDSIRSTIAACMLRAAGALLLTVALVPAAMAQDAGALPSRVGRLGDLAGAIYLAPQDRPDDWSPIGQNYPVTVGDNVWAAEGARAEVDFGGSQMRMSASTNVNVAALDEHTLVLFVAQGELILRVSAFEAGDSTVIDTPTTQVVVVQPGLYRIGVSPDQQRTTLTIREGEATAQVSAGLQQVLAGMTAVIDNAETTSAIFSAAYAPDEFDAWSAGRDAYYRDARNTTSVSPEMVGYDDLARYGAWQPDADYGNVWYPNDVPAGWAPYSDGYWTTVTGFGLTWVDRAPWGYAPFHYGRWAHIHGHWGWLPGNYVARPVWAPALVAWTSGGVVVAAGGAVYGWVPLGWREPYRPWWHGCSDNCWDHYNRPYQVDPRERDRYRDRAPPPDRYANWRVPGAVTAVQGDRLVARKPYVASERVALSGAALASAKPTSVAPTVAKPSPDRVPVVRPGAQGTPRPASVFYSSSKPAQMGLAVTGSGRLPNGQPNARLDAQPPSRPASAARGQPAGAASAQGFAPPNGQPNGRPSGRLTGVAPVPAGPGPNATVLDATGAHPPPHRAGPAVVTKPAQSGAGLPVLPAPGSAAPANPQPAANTEAARMRAPGRPAAEGDPRVVNGTAHTSRIQGQQGPAASQTQPSGEPMRIQGAQRYVPPQPVVQPPPQRFAPQPAQPLPMPPREVIRAPQPQPIPQPAPNPVVVAPNGQPAPANGRVAPGAEDRSRAPAHAPDSKDTDKQH